ncbi:MAG TPA: ThuA domain-containing protein [Vicinamibacterales bacterium]
MPRLAFVLLSAIVCLAVSCGAPEPRRATPDAEAPRPKVLYLTHSAGFKHDVVPLSMRLLPEIGRQHGFDVVVTKDLTFLSPEGLKPYDAVVFYTTGELPLSEEDKRTFLAWLRAGKGFVGIHSATDTFYQWPEYGEMIGGYFDGHPWHEEVAVRVEDRTHPATRHLPDPWVLTDEIYQFRNWDRSTRHVLLSLDPSSVDLGAEGVKRTDRDFALSWTSTYGEGRVFYTALGHRAEVWESPEYQRHLAGGIRWVLGVE